MTAIRQTDAVGIAGILETGRPRGLWMAKISPSEWMAADSTGEECARTSAPFGEALDWLMRRAGILREDERPQVIDQTASRYPRIRATFESAGRVRVVGAEITPWRGHAPKKKASSDGWGRNTIKPEYKPKMAKTAEPKPKRVSNNPSGRPKGSGRGLMQKTVELDREIRALVIAGVRDTQIAPQVGRSRPYVGKRIRAMLADGRLRAEDLPEERVRRMEPARKMWNTRRKSEKSEEPEVHGFRGIRIDRNGRIIREEKT